MAAAVAVAAPEAVAPRTTSEGEALPLPAAEGEAEAVPPGAPPPPPLLALTVATAVKRGVLLLVTPRLPVAAPTEAVLESVAAPTAPPGVAVPPPPLDRVGEAEAEAAELGTAVEVESREAVARARMLAVGGAREGDRGLLAVGRWGVGVSVGSSAVGVAADVLLG